MGGLQPCRKRRKKATFWVARACLHIFIWCWLNEIRKAAYIRRLSDHRVTKQNLVAGLRQPEGTDWHRRSTPVAVYHSLLSFPAPRYPRSPLVRRGNRLIVASRSWRVLALAKWPGCTAFTKLFSLLLRGILK